MTPVCCHCGQPGALHGERSEDSKKGTDVGFPYVRNFHLWCELIHTGVAKEPSSLTQGSARHSRLSVLPEGLMRQVRMASSLCRKRFPVALSGLQKSNGSL